MDPVNEIAELKTKRQALTVPGICDADADADAATYRRRRYVVRSHPACS